MNLFLFAKPMTTKNWDMKMVSFNNLRENYELFKEENKNVTLSRSSFDELRLPFVVPKAASAHLNCLHLYHENVCLLLKLLGHNG